MSGGYVYQTPITNVAPACGHPGSVKGTLGSEALGFVYRNR